MGHPARDDKPQIPLAHIPEQGRARQSSRYVPALLALHEKTLTRWLEGYFAIYLVGNTIGSRIVPPTAQQSAKEGVIVRTLVSHAASFWILLFLLRTLRFPVSRRLVCSPAVLSPLHTRANQTELKQKANAPYVIWTAAFNATFLLGYYLIERHAFPTHGRKVPALLESINKNGLVIFLIVRPLSLPSFSSMAHSRVKANLLTGAINVGIESMYASDRVALGVLVAYTAAVAGVAWVLRGRRIAL